jgi:hypothetical protein
MDNSSTRNLHGLGNEARIEPGLAIQGCSPAHYLSIMISILKMGYYGEINDWGMDGLIAD